MERTFWKSVTVNAPLYGADTPLSLFDDKLSSGWSLRNLDCYLKQKGCPEIPGVTSPMTYFGMWKVRRVGGQGLVHMRWLRACEAHDLYSLHQI